MSFLELAERILCEEEKSLTANEIWNLAVKKGHDKQLNSKGKTPWATLGAQIYVNTKDNPKSIFAKTKEHLDWETINKLTMNNDFKEFIDTVKIDLASKKIHKKEYDLVEELDNLTKK